MLPHRLPLSWPACLVAACLALAAPAWAEKPDHAGGKHQDKAEKREAKEDRKAAKREDKEDRKAAKREDKLDRKAEQRDDRYDGRRDGPRVGGYFDDRHRDAVRHHYTSYQGKRCPPGLAKKNNGCMPPGHARRWEVGQRLPANITIYQVPQPILVTLPLPPPRHRYVRVDGDILLIAIGTMLVIDGVNGLMN